MSYICDSKESMGLARVGIFRDEWFLIKDFGFRNPVGLKIEEVLCDINKCLFRFLSTEGGHFSWERWIGTGIFGLENRRKHFCWRYDIVNS